MLQIQSNLRWFTTYRHSNFDWWSHVISEVLNQETPEKIIGPCTRFLEYWRSIIHNSRNLRRVEVWVGTSSTPIMLSAKYLPGVTSYKTTSGDCAPCIHRSKKTWPNKMLMPLSVRWTGQSFVPRTLQLSCPMAPFVSEECLMRNLWIWFAKESDTIENIPQITPRERTTTPRYSSPIMTTGKWSRNSKSLFFIHQRAR